ncbi:ABC transporter permease [Ventosimonas gracilis]|uniref:ABC transporter permease n=1 Tax=Ventosimonas gracilis TaxID=1680762 RepID=A0A139STH8_9GAMM|nr:ABC transporter permease subunit [Ventosimonas gracilis]KXU37782.1 ABC transporter permease [Ventosimonas gracilis]
MDISKITEWLDEQINDGYFWLTDHASSLFDSFRSLLDGLFGIIDKLLALPPWWAVVLLVLLAGWFLLGRVFAIGAALGLVLCQAMGLWSETMTTLTLVFSATLMALIIGIPLGVLAGLSVGLSRASDVVLDFIQTMPAYIWLLPGLVLLGYGPATAMAATCLVAIPPAMRLTAHGIRMTPTAFRELATALGMKPLQALFKIRLPFALPSILAGVNQSLMLGFGMVVIAGIVGSGGLGQTVYNAVINLQIDQSINAGIAIVVLSIVLDRFTQRLAKGGAK